MKKIQFRTQSGSIYEVEDKEDGTGTWRRLIKGEGSIFVRTDEGPFNWRTPIAIGYSMIFHGPPLIEGALLREITTTPVVEVVPGEGIEVIDEGEMQEILPST